MTADRLQQLVQQNIVTGIDFVYVHESQTELDLVFFTHDSDPQADGIVGAVSLADIDIYASEWGLPPVEITGIAWTSADARTVLRVTVAEPGDFTRYRLRLSVAQVDHYYNDLEFTFKANCFSDVDCAPPPSSCPEDEVSDFPVDYRARDFASFRQALLAFANQRYPDWQDRLEADVGVMLTEVMAGLGDELAFYQDSIAREAYLETARQRQSVRQHARLVDYEMHNGRGASGWLRVDAAANDALPAGTQVQALSDNGGTIVYEIGRGLADSLAGVTFPIRTALNGLTPHCWDEDDRCVPRGATHVDVEGHHAAALVFDDPVEDPSGKWVVLAADGSSQSPCPKRWLVRVTRVEQLRDEVFGTDITRLHWEGGLPFELELEYLLVQGNILPLTAGQTEVERFVVGEEVTALGLPESAGRVSRAIERCGHDHVIYRQTLPDPEGRRLVWLGENLHETRPEVHLEVVNHDWVSWDSTGETWAWQRALLGVFASQPGDRHFTLEDGSWRRIVGYWRDGQEVVHEDYADSEGVTVTFGDGEFGRVPPEGTIFECTYRLGNGPSANAAPDAITGLVNPHPGVASVSNPFAIDNGEERESEDNVRRFAPQAFRSKTYRAVRSEDYAEAAERLPWVQRAGASQRWTGSWLTVFATPDPLGAVALAADQRQDMADQMARFRQAGRAVQVREPKYVDIDLSISVCVAASAYRGAVKSALMDKLIGSQQRRGFFSADHFSFGAQLERTALEACVQSTPGVRAVLGISFRRRGQFDWRSFDELSYAVAMDEVIRVENDPLYPGRGSVELVMEGGA